MRGWYLNSFRCRKLQVDGRIPRDGHNPRAKSLGLAQQVQPLEALDKGLLRGILGQRPIAQPAPRDGKDLVRVALDQLAIPVAVPLTDRGDRRRVGKPLICHGRHPPSAYQDKTEPRKVTESYSEDRPSA